MTITMKDLMAMSPVELDNLYKNSPIGEIPNGQSNGKVLFVFEISMWEVFSSLIDSLFWQGKIFYREQGFLLNRLTVFGFHMVEAKVYRGNSQFSEGESIILDYSKSSFIAQKIRDEIREVAPGLYLGQAYWDQTRVLSFALQF
ncbi:hypothetical protein WA1_36995 [Scytonema hofmannii PCC 7110]|uniref:Uncharacterized protein n=1 Tax=Scytonema hofmannii PCC 7110 TaxID=128403 RepID=A0A139X119_9CYAN|nr:hypothetical protein [Scytonema hofmannii]KYC38384.1 hypothetical protein WA1_36995 [Scytonema hofmannii PCC 7110]